MYMNIVLKTIIILALLVIGGIVYVSTQNKGTLSENLPPQEIENVENQEETEEEVVTETTTINLPLASLEEVGEFGPFGCSQYLNFHPVEVPQTSAVLGAVYEQLFSLPYEVAGTDDKNIIASQENLSFSSVEISDGDALLYLSGSVMGNHCADEVFRHQIEQAAFQFDTIDSITVFVNGQIFDWCVLSDADPSESGCDINPKPWIKQKEI